MGSAGVNPRIGRDKGEGMGSSGSLRAQIGTLIIATSGVQLANGFFNTLISLRVAIESFEATMAGLVLSSYFAGFTLAALRCGPIIGLLQQLGDRLIGQGGGEKWLIGTQKAL
jgi:hypothetical protein